MSESIDYKTFQKVKKPLDRLHRVENLVHDGTPDVNFCADGVESWIEMKSPTEPKRPKTPLFGSNHKLSMAQKNWFLEQRNAGGLSFVLIVTQYRWLLMSGKLADVINDMTVDKLIENCLWTTEKPVKGYQWAELRQVLITK